MYIYISDNELYSSTVCLSLYDYYRRKEKEKEYKNKMESKAKEKA